MTATQSEHEQVDAAIVSYLRSEVERLEGENEALKQALNRPLNVTVMPNSTMAVPSAHEMQILTAMQQTQYAVQQIAGALSRAYPVQ